MGCARRALNMARPGRWTWVHMGTLAVAFAVLTLACRGQWFFGDEWDFILLRGLHDPTWGLLRPHNEHWSTIPILWYRAVFSVFGLKTYWPYLFGLFATHLVVVHCAWRLMRRAGVGAPLATGVAAVLALFGAGAENLTWAFQVGFVGSLAAGMALLLLVDERGEPRRVGLVAAGATASLMLSGISVVMVGSIGLAAIGRWGWRKAFVVTAPAAALYLLWTQFQGRVGLGGATSVYRGGPSDIPRYVWGGMSTTLGTPFRSDRIGEVLLAVLLVAVAVRARSWWRRAPELLGLAAASPVMFAVISQGRGAIQDPAAGRYLYLTAGMLLPLIGFAVHQFVRDETPRVAVALVACLALTTVGVDQLRDNARLDRTRELTLKGQILAALSVAANEPTVSDRPDSTFSGDVTVDGLKRLQADGKLPRYKPTVADLAYARLALQVAVTYDGPIPGGGCRRVDLRGANAIIEPRGREIVFTLMSERNGRATLFVPFAGGNAGPRVIELTAGKRVTMHVVLPGELVLQLTGPAIVCGTAWTAP